MLMPMPKKKEKRVEYQYTIHFDETEGYLIKSEGVPEKEKDLTGE